MGIPVLPKLELETAGYALTMIVALRGTPLIGAASAYIV
jgi:hypothetical protein